MGKTFAQDVEALIEIFDRSDWDELHVEVDGLKIDLSKRGAPMQAVSLAPAAAAHPAAPASAAAPAASVAPAAAAHVAGAASAGGAHIPEGWVAVRAPNLGTFYRQPKPGAPPYVEIGQEVRPDTELCLIEVMKLFTSVTAGVRGIVRKLCVEDAEMVEYNQVLFLIEPKG
ncbi:MAG: acetyl-CoA carboxylase biotin carboxyl carrier protein [Reyranella sp.]|nr:acetyl-CoA carboxylase biotin carboxyl carrier protein [Reyranella sp.]